MGEAFRGLACAPLLIVLGLASVVRAAGARLFKCETREEVMERLYPGSYITVQPNRHKYLNSQE